MKLWVQPTPQLINFIKFIIFNSHNKQNVRIIRTPAP